MQSTRHTTSTSRRRAASPPPPELSNALARQRPARSPRRLSTDDLGFVSDEPFSERGDLNSELDSNLNLNSAALSSSSKKRDVKLREKISDKQRQLLNKTKAYRQQAQENRLAHHRAKHDRAMRMQQRNIKRQIAQDEELAKNVQRFESPRANGCAPLFYTLNFDISSGEEPDPCIDPDSSEAEVEADQPRPPCRPQPSM